MSAVIAQVNLSSLAPRPKPITETVSVGKDVLELLAGAMYVDPLNVYREYIQNAADAIDEARDAGISFEEGGGIQIAMDHTERTIRIRDNGISISSNDFVRRLVTIGASHKRGTKLRGFRGVGRLSGLGYCQELYFRGKTGADSKVTEIRWDGRLLKEKLRDPKYTSDLATLIQEIVTVTKFPAAGFPERFFEVEMRKVSRLKNDILLNEEAVRQYLAQIAPVPFNPNFSFGDEIKSVLASHGIRAPINVELNDGRGPIYHMLENVIKLSDVSSDEVRAIEYLKIVDSDGETCAIGWMADHSYFGSFPKRLGIGGLRLRSGNIQVGDELITTSLFPEARFCGWTIGEVHVISPKILPNGRRDEFEPSNHYAHLQSELTLRAKEVAQRIRERSSQRNQLRSVQLHISTVDTWMQVANQKSVPALILEVLHELSTERLNKAVYEASKFSPDSAENRLSEARLKDIEKELTRLSSKIKRKSSSHTLKTEIKKPISAALKTILSSAKTPDAGITLSLEVLDAVHAAS